VACKGAKLALLNGSENDKLSPFKCLDVEAFPVHYENCKLQLLLKGFSVGQMARQRDISSRHVFSFWGLVAVSKMLDVERFQTCHLLKRFP
jgi:hypothetical protein